jgi:hypothetical protein
VLGSDESTDCVCDPGYNGTNGGPCGLCPANFYCEGENVSHCPSYSNSSAGSDEATDCTCIPGFYGLNGATCTQCPANSFCVGGQPTHQTCDSVHPNMASPPGECVREGGFSQGWVLDKLLRDGEGPAPPIDGFLFGGNLVIPKPRGNSRVKRVGVINARARFFHSHHASPNRTLVVGEEWG